MTLLVPTKIGNAALEYTEASEIDFDNDYAGLGSSANSGKTAKMTAGVLRDGIAQSLFGVGYGQTFSFPSNGTITAEMDGGTVNNDGATGQIQLTLPTGVPGMAVEIAKTALYSIQVFPVMGDTLRGVTTSYTIRSSTVAVFECAVAGQWEVTFHGDDNVIDVAAFGLQPGGADNSTSILAAIADGGDSVEYRFPSGSFYHSQELVWAGNYQHLKCVGPEATVLVYTGLTGNGVTFGEVGKGYVSYNNSLKGVTFRHADATGTKVALTLIDQAEFHLEDVRIDTDGGNSVGMKFCGRQHFTYTNLLIEAPIGIQWGHNTESTTPGSFSADFTNGRQLEIIRSSAPTTWPDAAILFGEYNTDGTLNTSLPVEVTSYEATGVSMIGHIFGVHWIASTIPTTYRSHTVAFRNHRMEQVPAAPVRTITGAAAAAGLIRITSAGHGFITGSQVTIASVVGTTEANGTWLVTRISSSTFDLVGSTFVNAYVSGGTARLERYAFYIKVPTLTDLSASTHALWGVHVEDFQGDTAGGVGGIFGRGIEHLKLEEFDNLGGSSRTCDVDDINTLVFDGVYQASSSTCSFGTKLKPGILGSHRQGFPYPTHGLWTSHPFVDTQNPQLRIGDMEIFTYVLSSFADAQTVLLPLDADAKTVRAGHVIVKGSDAAGVTATLIADLAPGSGTNGVTSLTGSSANTAVTSTAGRLSLEATGTLTDTTVRNRLGVTVVLTIFAIIYRTSKT